MTNKPKPITPDVPEPPDIAAAPKDLDSPVMVRTIQDSVQPSDRDEIADISAEALKTEGQRHINLIWETVQAIIALTVTGTGMYVTSVLALRDEGSPDAKAAAVAALVFITGVANLIVGFYFGRVNHANVGGTGTKKPGEVR